ncbi:histone deacetylase family protein [Magnetospira sp. QH-2]|uniref:histone deacetylase family protein n=1 Tax=Magnetospira sp. (strain QH-2) TaxID=1288970 RepID=UPI0003E8122D|nr:histone deacetylase family protein [Magnetospira sp. QH-2]CCQ74148.1 putative histone deacetylase [Magnetospira sp. QH-2]
MSTLYYTHPACLDHEMGAGHPERPDRLRAINRILEGEAYLHLHRVEAPRADRALIEKVHPDWYVDDILENVPAQGHRHLDPDTALCPHTPEAALRSAGAMIDAVEQVMAGKARNAFCGVRPPGHHAEPEHAMGFCFFANAAIGALHAHESCGAERVAVVDFDVHHGNGTQAICENYPYMLYASTHQAGAYPGTGATSDRGKHDNVCNHPLDPGSGSEDFRRAYEDVIFPKIRQWKPDLLIISAGFDAHAKDPLAYLRLQDEDFGWVTEGLLTIADDCCDGRAVSVLEGGYDLTGLAGGVAAHVSALMGH